MLARIFGWLLYILEMTLFGMKQLTERNSYRNVVNKHAKFRKLCGWGVGGNALTP